MIVEVIVREVDSSLELVRQTEHARLSHVLARRMLGPQGDPVALAIRHHDDGWNEYDSIPRLIDGQIVDYRSVPREEHLSILEKSAKRCARINSYTGWLVSRHGCSFHRDQTDSLTREFLNEQEAYRDKLLNPETAPVKTQREIDFDRLQFADAISLFVLDPWNDRWRWERDHPGALTVERTDIDCFTVRGSGFEPGTKRFEFHYRNIPKSEFDTKDQLRSLYLNENIRSGAVTLSIEEK